MEAPGPGRVHAVAVAGGGACHGGSAVKTMQTWVQQGIKEAIEKRYLKSASLIIIDDCDFSRGAIRLQALLPKRGPRHRRHLRDWCRKFVPS